MLTMCLVLGAKVFTWTISCNPPNSQETASVLLCTGQVKKIKQGSSGGVALLKLDRYLRSLLECYAPITDLIDSLNETCHGSLWSHCEIWKSFQVTGSDLFSVLCGKMRQGHLFLFMEVFGGFLTMAPRSVVVHSMSSMSSLLK